MKITVAPVFTTLLLAIAVPTALAETDWLRAVTGSYRGDVSGEDYRDPVITEFFLTPEGTVVGSYLIVESSEDGISEPIDGESVGVVLGALTDCEAIMVAQLSCTWHDRYGSGSLKLTFDEDFSGFEGRWNLDSDPATYPWTGAR
jgi:hypothetical protein